MDRVVTRRGCIVATCDRQHHARGLCSTHYAHWKAHGVVPDYEIQALDRTIEERFWPKVKVAGPTECWHWIAYIHPSGYGMFRRDGRMNVAHRVAYELIVGEIPDGLVLDHLCRVRHCVNPAHLEPVTEAENILRGISVSAINNRKTHCIRGHELTPENCYSKRSGVRQCRKCADLSRSPRSLWLAEDAPPLNSLRPMASRGGAPSGRTANGRSTTGRELVAASSRPVPPVR